jgi:hypothetical protein
MVKVIVVALMLLAGAFFALDGAANYARVTAADFVASTF